MGSRRQRSWTNNPSNNLPSPSVPHTSRNTYRSSEDVPPFPPENDTVPGTSASTAEPGTPHRTDTSGNGNNPSNRGHQRYHIDPGTSGNFDSNSMPYFYSNSNSMPYYYVTYPSTRLPMFEGSRYPPDTHSYQFNEINGQGHFQQAPTFNPNWYNQQYDNGTSHGSSSSSSGNGNNPSNRGHQRYHIDPGTSGNFDSNSMPYYYSSSNSIPYYYVTYPSTRLPMFEGSRYPPDTHSYQFNEINGQGHFQQAPTFNPNWYNQQYDNETSHGSSSSSSGNGNNPSNGGHQQYHIDPGTSGNFDSNSMPYYYSNGNSVPYYYVTYPSTRLPMFEGSRYPPDTHSYQFNEINGQGHFQQAPTFNPNWYNQQYGNDTSHGSSSSSENYVPLFVRYHYEHPYEPVPPGLFLHWNWHSPVYHDGWINNNQVGTIGPPPQFGSRASGWFTNSPYNVYARPTEEMMRRSGSASQYDAPLTQEMMQPYAHDVSPPPPPPPACSPPPSPAIVSPPSPAFEPLPASAVTPLCPSEDSLSKEQADKWSSQIRQQVEYYFSEQNFPTDDTLKSLLDENGWISIHDIAEIKKINRTTNNIPFILEALQSSTSIEVQGNKIRRHIAESTSHCQEVQKNSSFNSTDVSDKNSRFSVVEDSILEAKRDLDICLSRSDNHTVEQSGNDEYMVANTVVDEALKHKRSGKKTSLELELYIQQSPMVEPANNSAYQNSALDDCLNSESSQTDTKFDTAGNPILKNPSNFNVCLDTSISQKYSKDGVDDHNFEPRSFISSGRNDWEHKSRVEDNDQSPNTRIDPEDNTSDQNVPSVVTQGKFSAAMSNLQLNAVLPGMREMDGKKVGKYALEKLSEEEANRIDNAVMRFHQDELAMHSICQRPTAVTRLFNHDTSFFGAASGEKQKNKGNSKSDSSNNLCLFSSSFSGCSNSGNQQEPVSESLIGRSCFFMGPTPPENKDSHNELLSETSPPAAAIQKYSEFHTDCINDWLSKGKGCSEEMFKLFRFWSYFLREHFIKSVYEKFKMLAIEDFSSNHDYGIQCLFRFFSSSLKKRFNKDIYKDFEKLAVDFYQKGCLYGVEKYWEFHHCRTMDCPIKMHPFLEKLLDEEYQNIDDFHYKQIQICHE